VKKKEVEWTKGGVYVREPVQGVLGFIYEITFVDRTKYIGKKAFFNFRTLKALKNGKKRKNHVKFINKNKGGKRVRYEIVKKESDWKSYTGSFDKSKWQNNTPIKKEILCYALTEKQMTFFELEFQIINSVLLNEKYRNDNILGKFYRKDLIVEKE
jgi:hypothetical protein